MVWRQVIYVQARKMAYKQMFDLSVPTIPDEPFHNFRALKTFLN